MGGELEALAQRALAEDLGRDGDLTGAATVAAGARARARIDQKAPGVLAGLDGAGAVFRALDPALECRALAEEGAWREPGGGPVAEVEGRARSILAGERTALNLLARLSGVATLTARYVRAVEGTGARILSTRKTTPGLRALERRAVEAGGGEHHRDGLHDAMLVKENHAALAGGVREATRLALAAAGRGVAVVIECTTLAEVEEALAAGAPRVLIDNFSAADARAAVELVAGRAAVEASGGVSLQGARELAEAGVGLISVGALTHSAPALDLSLTLQPI